MGKSKMMPFELRVTDFPFDIERAEIEQNQASAPIDGQFNSATLTKARVSLALLMSEQWHRRLVDLLISI